MTIESVENMREDESIVTDRQPKTAISTRDRATEKRAVAWLATFLPDAIL